MRHGIGSPSLKKDYAKEDCRVTYVSTCNAEASHIELQDSCRSLLQKKKKKGLKD